MAAENPLPDERGAGASPRAVASGFAVALIIIALVAVLGWLHTVRELNRIVAHEVVRGEVRRQARLAHAKAHASADKLKQEQLSAGRPEATKTSCEASRGCFRTELGD